MKLFIVKRAEKDLDKLPDVLAKMITNHILRLSDNPFPPNSKKLHALNCYRLRVGSFRVLYQVDSVNKEITALRVADRNMIYR